MKTARERYYIKEQEIKDMIKKNIISPSSDRTFEQIRNSVLWAWENWEGRYLEPYKVNGSLPDSPTEKFVSDWVDNEPFEETLNEECLDYLLVIFDENFK